MEAVKPVSVAGATIVIQVTLLIIMFLGIFLERRRETEVAWRRERGYALALVLAIISILFVVLSADLYTVWGPIMGDLQLPTIDRSYSLFVVFLLDIGSVIMLISWTGGTRASPFTAVLFLLPTLAVFLRETPLKFLTYSVLVGIFYWFTCEAKNTHSSRLDFGIDRSVAAHRAVNIGCLVLTTITAYITRPQPV